MFGFWCRKYHLTNCLRFHLFHTFEIGQIVQAMLWQILKQLDSHLKFRGIVCVIVGEQKPENGKQQYNRFSRSLPKLPDVNIWILIHKCMTTVWTLSSACGVQNVYMQGYIYMLVQHGVWRLASSVPTLYRCYTDTIQMLHAFQRQTGWWQGLAAIFQTIFSTCSVASLALHSQQDKLKTEHKMVYL